MIKSGDVISYLNMCREEGVNLQRGMNYRLRDGQSVILMSVRPGAPYFDRVEEDGKILIYEGHDVPKMGRSIDPKKHDQQMHNPGGGLTQNGLFHEASAGYKAGKRPAEIVKVYEKIHSGIWAYNGLFKLIDSWQESSGGRKVFKFKLQLADEEVNIAKTIQGNIGHERLIPTAVKMEVWARDKGKCIKCGSTNNLHFDHIIPYAKGGSSLVAANIQILCARHNLAKRDKIE